MTKKKEKAKKAPKATPKTKTTKAATKIKAKAAPKKAKVEAKKTAAPKAAPQTQTAQQPIGGEITSLPLNIHGQYVRDISFENPSAPQSLRAGQPTPIMNVNFGMDARTLDEQGLENMYEVLLTVNVEAKRDDKVVFIAEVMYGVTVSVGESVPQEQIHPLLLIEVPRLAFPFVRQVLCDVAIQGGFPPLLLNPVNFQQLYVERFKNELAAQQSNQA